MPLLANVRIWTTRPTYNATTKVTGGYSGATPLLSGVPAHIEPMTQTDFHLLPQPALEAEYLCCVDSGTNVRTGDFVTTITLPDGITSWPADGPGAPNEYWRVCFHEEQAAMLLPQRTLYLKRERGGGPM